MRYRITSDALSAILSDGAVLLSLQTKRYFSLNDTGTRVWGMLECGAGTAEIVAALVGEYDVDTFEVERAVGNLIEGLVAERLIEPADA